MLGRTNAGGVGGANLNFAVVGGTTQPSNPKANTIWVNTDTAISSYAFSTTEPSNPTAGMVWFQTGSASSVAFPATEENVIMVYPNACKQFVSGAWVGKTAMSYLNNTWASWSLVVYDKGDENTFSAIGYIWGSAARAAVPSVDYYNTSGAKITENNVYDAGVAGWHNTGGLCVSDAVDLSGYSTLTFEYTGVNYNNAVVFYVSTEGDSYNENRDLHVAATTGSGTLSKTLNIANLSGMYHIGIALQTSGNFSNTTTVTMVKIIAE